MDSYSRKILGWWVSNSMNADLCMDAMEDAVSRVGAPNIFKTNQDSAQFTSYNLTGFIKATGIQISMDGKGWWVKNMLVETLWHSLKCGDVYLNALDTITEVRLGIGNYFQLYSLDRMSQSLNRQTSDQVYDGSGSVMWLIAA